MSFPTTRLSVVARTRSGDEETRRVAYAAIIEAYWKPAYKHLRLKWSLDPDAAADLTQEFFTTTLEKDIVERYDPERSRFRTYLRLCLDGFASNARKAERRLKRGGGVTMVPLDFETAEGEIGRHEPAVSADVDEVFYREWVRGLLERSVADLRRQAGESRPARRCSTCSRDTTLPMMSASGRPMPISHESWASRRRRSPTTWPRCAGSFAPSCSIACASCRRATKSSRPKRPDCCGGKR